MLKMNYFIDFETLMSVYSEKNLSFTLLEIR